MAPCLFHSARSVNHSHTTAEKLQPGSAALELELDLELVLLDSIGNTEQARFIQRYCSAGT